MSRTFTMHGTGQTVVPLGRKKCKMVSEIYDGGGDPLVLIHGLGATPYLYEGIARGLAAHGWCVYMVHLPDHGRSGTVTTFNEMLGAVIGWMDSIRHRGELLGRVPVIGHSLGGFIGVFLAHQRPDLVESLVTVASPLGEECDAGRGDLHELTVNLAKLGIDTARTVLEAELRLLPAPTQLARFVRAVMRTSAANSLHPHRLLAAMNIVRLAPPSAPVIAELERRRLPMRFIYSRERVIRPLPHVPGRQVIFTEADLHSFLIADPSRFCQTIKVIHQGLAEAHLEAGASAPITA